ncbi:DUF3221 domain-containing protein [Oceanobacillus picturae]|uniref:DUF3221 domain-containing protein n=1 Tax=Oceanobacillus picturae TaxID=171693 RepID=UPI000E69822D|nr:DUF3221 domain-containing protein [Oceanobacillus picturae]RIU92636.1 DUF3221 domain-containing protein [Oceanobacillus picturae]
MNILLPSYKRVLIACFIAFVAYFSSHVILSNVAIASPALIPNQHMIQEGYVVSKSWDGIWIAKQPVSASERLTNLFTGHTDSYFVEKHPEIGAKPLFHDLKINQKVRIYSDYLRESNPPKPSAYFIEKLS